MAHKVEIENLNTASRAQDPKVRQLRNNFQDVVNEIDRLHQFIDTACADCADDNETVIKRTLFESKIASINTALNAANAAVTEFGTTYLNLSDYWSADIADTSGLANPEPVVGEPAVEEPAPDVVPDPDPTNTDPASGA